jgi:hypothetical protein
MKYIMTILLGFGLSACTSSGVNNLKNGPAYVHNGINFGHGRNANFKKGVQDACRTSEGHYTKDHTLFNNNISYKSGWEDGRLQCKGK